MKSLLIGCLSLFSIYTMAGECNIQFEDLASKESKTFIGDTKQAKEVVGFAGVYHSKEAIIKTQNYEITLIQQGREPGLVMTHLKREPQVRVGSILGETYIIFGKSLDMATMNPEYNLGIHCKR